jgi:hypothetical protein
MPGASLASLGTDCTFATLLTGYEVCDWFDCAVLFELFELFELVWDWLSLCPCADSVTTVEGGVPDLAFSTKGAAALLTIGLAGLLAGALRLVLEMDMAFPQDN